MLIGRFLLLVIMLSTFIIAALTTNLTNNNPLLSSSTNPNEKLEVLVVPIPSAANSNECPEACELDYCLKYKSMIRNCTKLIRDQCDCCTVCLRTENQICGGRLNVYGLCEQDFLCYKSDHLSEQTGICIKGKVNDLNICK
jgi:hypothetical protein